MPSSQADAQSGREVAVMRAVDPVDDNIDFCETSFLSFLELDQSPSSDRADNVPMGQGFGWTSSFSSKFSPQLWERSLTPQGPDALFVEIPPKNPSFVDNGLPKCSTEECCVLPVKLEAHFGVSTAIEDDKFETDTSDCTLSARCCPENESSVDLTKEWNECVGLTGGNKSVEEISVIVGAEENQTLQRQSNFSAESTELSSMQVETEEKETETVRQRRKYKRRRDLNYESVALASFSFHI